MVCYYTFRALHSGKFLHKANSGKTNDVHQWSGAGANNTLWAFASAGNGYYYIKNKTGNYLENKNGKASDGNNVITGKLSKKNSQKWKLLRLSKKPDLDVRWKKNTRANVTHFRYKKIEIKKNSQRGSVFWTNNSTKSWKLLPARCVENKQGFDYSIYIPPIDTSSSIKYGHGVKAKSNKVSELRLDQLM